MAVYKVQRGWRYQHAGGFHSILAADPCGYELYAFAGVFIQCGYTEQLYMELQMDVQKERSHSLKTVLMFILVNVLSLGVSLGVLWVCKNPIGINQDVAVNIFGKAISISSDLICKIPASVFSAVANFVLTKLFVFNKETHPEENGGN